MENHMITIWKNGIIHELIPLIPLIGWNKRAPAWSHPPRGRSPGTSWSHAFQWSDPNQACWQFRTITEAKALEYVKNSKKLYGSKEWMKLGSRLKGCYHLSYVVSSFTDVFFKVFSEIWNKSCSLVIGGVLLIIWRMVFRWDVQLCGSRRHETMQRCSPRWWHGSIIGLQSFLIFLRSPQCNYYTQFHLGWCILCTVMHLFLCCVFPQCSLADQCLVRLWSSMSSLSLGVISLVAV